MADPFEAFSDAFNQSMGRERELANKMKMLKYQSNLEAQQPTPEMRLFELFKTDPENFKAYMRAKDPLDAFYKQGMLNYYMGNLGLEREKMKYMMDQGTNKQRDYNFLIEKGLKPEEAIKLLFKPDMMQQVMQQIFGEQNQQNNNPQPQPQKQNGIFSR
jgi:hypothetical protein